MEATFPSLRESVVTLLGAAAHPSKPTVVRHVNDMLTVLLTLK